MGAHRRTSAARRAGAFGVAALVIAIDQAGKQWARSSLTLGEAVPITSFFGWRHVTNPGAAFGWLREHPETLTGVAIGATVVVCLICLLGRLPTRGLAAGLALVMGGAAGNLIDRFYQGHVTDFIDLHVGAYSWPEFNVADIAVTIGAFLVAGYLYVGANEEFARAEVARREGIPSDIMASLTAESAPLVVTVLEPGRRDSVDEAL